MNAVKEKNVVICPSCSAENVKGKKFCIKCGTALTRTNMGNSEGAEAVVKNNANKHVKKAAKKSGGKAKKFSLKLFVVVAAIAVVIAGAGIFIAYNNSSSIEYDYQSLGFNYHIKATEKEKFRDTSVKYNKRYNDTAVSVLKSAYEYKDAVRFEERFEYLSMSDEAYKVLSLTTNQYELAQLEEWRNNTNLGKYWGSLSGGSSNPMCKYICENSKNYTYVPDKKLYFVVYWGDGDLLCYVGSEDNIMGLLYGNYSYMHGKMGAATTSSIENIPLSNDEYGALSQVVQIWKDIS